MIRLGAYSTPPTTLAGSALPSSPQLGHYPLDKLTPTRIARHYRDLEQHGRKDEQDKGGPLSANTVHKAHVVIGAILDAAIEDGHITSTPRH